MRETATSIQCQCGAFEAHVLHPERAMHLVCYCRDCQSFAHFVDAQREQAAVERCGMLDALGGTEMIAIAPANMTVLRGKAQLACMSLSPQGTYRWTTRCCHSPIATLPRQARLAHVSVPAVALRYAGVDVEEVFGPIRLQANRASAHQHASVQMPVLPGWGKPLVLLRYGLGLLFERISGRWQRNPFLAPPAWVPVVDVHVLTQAQRQQLRERAAHPPEPSHR